MTPVQQKLLQMLDEVVAMCRENGITYYAAGGTALGAARHGGFIPWDDDVDIMMPREDWERFVEVARNGLPNGRVLCCMELDENYPHVFGRYTDTETCSIHYNHLLGGAPEGLVIDIFILDAVPDDGESFDEHRRVLALYNDLANELGYSYPMSSNAAELNRYSKRLRAEGRRAVLDELAAQVGRYSLGEGEYLVMRWAAAPRLFHKSVFGFHREEPFEHLSISVPSRLNDYLVQHYGDDWMQLPSDAGRLTHDAITFTDVGYQAVFDDNLPFIDVERTRKAILKRRQYHIDHMYELHRAEDLRAHIFATFARMVTEADEGAVQASDRKAQEEPLLRNNVGDRFAEFYRIQLMPELEGREEYLAIRRYYDPVCVELDDKVFAQAVEYLLDTNRVGFADRLLRVRERAHVGVSSETRRLRNLCEAVRLPRSLADVGCFDEAFEFSCDLLERRSDNYSNWLFYLEALFRREAWNDLACASEQALQLFPESGEFLKYKADSAFALVDGESLDVDARGAYSAALKRTTNAFVHHDAVHAFPDLAGEIDNAVQAIPGKRSTKHLLEAGNKAIALLRELRDECEALGIAYYLGPLSCRLAIACESDAITSPELDVLVPATQMEQLAHALIALDRDDRAVDCWLTNGHYPAFALDYVDKTTTFFQIDEGDNVGAPGVRVRVLPLRSYGSMGKAKSLDTLERGWHLNGYNLAKSASTRQVVAAAEARAYMLIGRKRAAKRLFSHLVNISSQENTSGTVSIRQPGSEVRSFPAYHFQGGEALQLGGVAFNAPADAEGFLGTMFGADWKDSMASVLNRYKSMLVSANLSYEAFLRALSEEGCSAQKYFSLMRGIRLGMLPLVNDLRIRKRAMRIAERSRDRKVWCDRLDEQWHVIQELLSKDDFEKLARIYEGYEKDAKQYLKANLGLCPSKRHLDVLCTVLRARGEEGVAKKLESLAPRQHYVALGEGE